MRRLVVLAFAVIALGGTQAFAHQGRQALACGPLGGGVNSMTANLSCPSPGLTLTANGSTLDCRGYTLIGPGSGNGIYVAGKTGVTIKNCNVKNYSNNYFMIKMTKSTLTNDTSVKNTGTAGFYLQSSFSNQFTDNLATGGVAPGSSRGFLLVQSGGNVFQDNAAVGNAFKGYDLEKNSTKNRFNDNIAISNNSAGFLLGPTSLANAFTFNRAMSNVGGGILVMAGANTNSFRDNAASGNVGGFNCRDLGAGNSWIANTGGISSPAAICP